MQYPGFGATAAALALLCCRPAAAQISTVSVTGGSVAGITADGVASFKGIPFAAPPVGKLRWKAPQPVLPWSGTRQTDHFASPCMQDDSSAKRLGVALIASEDCLYLNVWTPARSAGEKLPVMVWIHGGGMVVGMTNAPLYDGTRLAHKGVVLVSIAYRLGVFGYLADARLSAESPHHVSGNYGVLDVISALQWVRTNIGRFGGDPSRVTVFGQSAGGSTVGMLAASPLAKGLFQRAISESGDITSSGLGGDAPLAGGLPGLSAAEAVGKKFLAKLGAADIAAARALAAQVLLKAQAGVERFLPVLDGYVAPADQYDLIEEGRLNDTPLLIGFNADEGALIVPRLLPDVTPARFEALIHSQVGSDADEILPLYPHATNQQAKQAAGDVIRDGDMGWSAWAWASLYSRKEQDNVYLYYFDRHSPQAPLGPTHSAEISYVFGNLVSPVKGTPFGLDGPPGPADAALSEQIQSYWVNFARTGDPNGPGLPRWPAFSAASQQALYLDEHPHTGPVPNLTPIQAFDRAYARARQTAPYSAPQTVVHIAGGRTINIVCLGQGSPTVILTPGLGGWSMAWWEVQRPLAQRTRVCAWDPAGYGFSGPSAEPQDIVHTTQDLEQALRAGGIPGPDVMVAHSLGAYDVLRFTDRHPKDVVGMVLVDPSIPDQAAIQARLGPKVATLGASMRARDIKQLEDCAAGLRSGALKSGTPQFERCTAAPGYLDAGFSALKAAMVRLNADPARLLTQASSLKYAEKEDSRQVINAQRHYGNLPLIVLTAGSQHLNSLPTGTPGTDTPAKSAQLLTEMNAALARFYTAGWIPGHDAYAALSTRGRNQLVPDSSHLIQVEKPETVISAVNEVLDQGGRDKKSSTALRTAAGE